MKNLPQEYELARFAMPIVGYAKTIPYFRIECCNIAPCFYAEASTVSKPTFH